MAGITDAVERRVRRLRRGLVVLACGGLLIAGCRIAIPQGRIDVSLDGKTLSCEVAKSEVGRERGLQGRPALGDDQGMLLVNDAPGPVRIQIKALPYAIDVAIVDSDRRVVRVASLDPESARDLGTAAPALYVVEARAGWLERNGVGVGSVLDFPGRQP